MVIATPDHWHALPAIEAVLAGKDVYVEKPVGHNVAEGQAMIKAARKTSKVMAVGTQQRSSSTSRRPSRPSARASSARSSGSRPGTSRTSARSAWDAPRHRRARERRLRPLARPRAQAAVQPEPVPPPLPLVLRLRRRDDERLGRPPQRHRPLGARREGPAGGVRHRAASSPRDDDRDTPDTLQVVYDFPGTTLTYSMRKGNGLPLNGHEYGILFCGTDGSLMLDRSGFEIIARQGRSSPTASSSSRATGRLRKIDPGEAAKGQGRGRQRPHIDNFLECIKSRDADRDIEIGHRSTNTCHLGNIAYKLGRKLDWDDETETFKGDKEANALLAREPRRGYELPKV